jgi:hypothetical protein
MKKLVLMAIAMFIILQSNAQADTVKVSLGKTSQLIFMMGDRTDLETLKRYNFQGMFDDILKRIEESDSIPKSEPVVAAEEPKTNEEENWRSSESASSNDNDNDNDEDWNEKVRNRTQRGRIGKTWQSFNFDLGTNNYLSKGKFQDTSYSVRPWGSWYLGASSIQRTRITRHVFLEWGLGISWYNFKFQNDDVMLQRTDDHVEFVTDTRDVNHKKSKLTASYINASFVPVIDFGGHSRKPRMWDGYGSSFRIGFGPYIGYRIASRSKIVYKDDGDLEKEKQRNSFYLNNIRYGARLQLGIRGTDLFFNYDLNELFASNKGPNLNAFSFGVIF